MSDSFGKAIIITGPVKWIGDPEEDPANNIGFQIWKKALENVMKNEKPLDWIDKLFDYHNPKEIDPNRFTEIRLAAKNLARTIAKHGGRVREKDIEKSLDKLRECVYYAIASIVVPE